MRQTENSDLGILHVLEKVLGALHQDNPLERWVFAHDSAAAVGSYDELTQSHKILQLNKFHLNLQPSEKKPFCSTNKTSHSFNGRAETFPLSDEYKVSGFLFFK